MSRALSSGIHIGPGTVRVAAGLVLVAAVAAIVAEWPEMVRYAKSETM